MDVLDVKRTTVNLPKDMLRKIKFMAVERETTQSSVITELIAKGLNTEKNEGEITSRVVNDKLEIDPPQGYGGLKMNELVSRFDLGRTNSVKLKKELHEQ
jgi:hypothetical protein